MGFGTLYSAIQFKNMKKIRFEYVFSEQSMLLCYKVKCQNQQKRFLFL